MINLWPDIPTTGGPLWNVAHHHMDDCQQYNMNTLLHCYNNPDPHLAHNQYQSHWGWEFWMRIWDSLQSMSTSALVLQLHTAQIDVVINFTWKHTSSQREDCVIAWPWMLPCHRFETTIQCLLCTICPQLALEDGQTLHYNGWSHQWSLWHLHRYHGIGKRQKLF